MNKDKKDSIWCDLLVQNADDVGLRIDKFLRKELQLTHALICRYERNKQIMVNEKSVKIGYRLQMGDQIRLLALVDINEASQEKSKERRPKNPISKLMIDKIKGSIILEDENIVAINKPFGVATQSGGSLRFSIDDIMRKINPEIRIVHRLDKETSGLMVLAKNRRTAATLSAAFKDGSIEKTYLAVVSPIPLNDSGIIECMIDKDTSSKISRSFITDMLGLGGKQSVSEYRVLKKNVVANFALVQFMPKTGRTHQIRLHAKHMGCPIVGDYRYGGRLDLGRRLQLFAHKIKLPPQIHTPTIICEGFPDFFLMKP